MSVAGLTVAITISAVPNPAADPTWMAPELTNWSYMNHWKVPGPVTAIVLTLFNAILSVPRLAKEPVTVNW